jgi:hypothetical protein
MLAKFIIANLEPIAADWHNYAKTCLPPAAEMTVHWAVSLPPMLGCASSRGSIWRK